MNLKIFSLAIILSSTTGALFAEGEAPKIESIADSVASLDELTFLAVTFDNVNQAGLNAEALENLFFQFAEERGTPFVKAENADNPFFTLRVSTLVVGDMVTLDQNLVLQEWCEFTRGNEKYRTLARTWTTGHISTAKVVDTDGLANLGIASLEAIFDNLEKALADGSKLSVQKRRSSEEVLPNDQPNGAMPESNPRKWSSAGKVIVASFNGFDGDDKVKLKLEDGRVITFPISRLSAEDKTFLQRK